MVPHPDAGGRHRASRRVLSRPVGHGERGLRPAAGRPRERDGVRNPRGEARRPRARVGWGSPTRLHRHRRQWPQAPGRGERPRRPGRRWHRHPGRQARQRAGGGQARRPADGLVGTDGDRGQFGRAGTGRDPASDGSGRLPEVRDDPLPLRRLDRAPSEGHRLCQRARRGRLPGDQPLLAGDLLQPDQQRRERGQGLVHPARDPADLRPVEPARPRSPGGRLHGGGRRRGELQRFRRHQPALRPEPRLLRVGWQAVDDAGRHQQGMADDVDAALGLCQPGGARPRDGPRLRASPLVGQLWRRLRQSLGCDERRSWRIPRHLRSAGHPHHRLPQGPARVDSPRPQVHGHERHVYDPHDRPSEPGTAHFGHLPDGAGADDRQPLLHRRGAEEPRL